MRAKSLILLVVALGCGMVAAVAVSKAVMSKGGGDTAEPTVEIFVAAKDIKNTEKLTADVVKLEQWPQSRLPEGALFKLEQLEGKFSNQNMFAGEPILEKKLSESRESLSTRMPPGYRVFNFTAADIGYIKPGDRVDVVGTFKLEGRGSSAETKTVMRNVEVFAINGISTRDPDGKHASGNANFQLLVKETQVEALTLAHSLGELRISLCPLEETDEKLKNDNGESFLSWVNQKGASKKDKEPATSITASISDMMGGAQAPEEEKHEMLIVTPNGITRYQWSASSQLPKQVIEEEENEGGEPPQGRMTNWQPPIGNVYSGYGGYTPTYPTMSAPAPGQQPVPNAGTAAPAVSPQQPSSLGTTPKAN